MRIGITLNEVLRDFIGQFAYTYDKYIGPIDIKKNPITSFDLINHFKFDTVDDMNRFLYTEAALEIFGHADQMHVNIMSIFNNFLTEIEDEMEHEIVLISRESNNSIPSTMFFLSKLGCRARNIKFVHSYKEKWEHADVLITANPVTLRNKPEGKISVKVDYTYNEGVEADYTIDSLIDFMRNVELRDRILNTKITTFEEINDNERRND